MSAPSLTAQNPYEHLLSYLHYCEHEIDASEKRGSKLKALKNPVRVAIKGVRQCCDPLIIQEMYPTYSVGEVRLASDQLSAAHLKILHASRWFNFIQGISDMDTYEAFVFKRKIRFFHHVIYADDQDTT